MKKTLRAWALALALVVGLGVSPVAMTGCSLSIFQSDPVGASLKTTKDTYEAAVKTAGRLYVAGQITEPQIRKIRDEANKVYKAYAELATIHEVAGVKEGDVRLAQLGSLLDVLVNLLAAFSAQGVK